MALDLIQAQRAELIKGTRPEPYPPHRGGGAQSATEEATPRHPLTGLEAQRFIGSLMANPQLLKRYINDPTFYPTPKELTLK